MPRRRPSKKLAEQKTVSVASAISALDAKMKLLAQRMKIIENNEQVIGRTLVSHNKKLKEMEASAGQARTPSTEALKAELRESLKAELREELFKELEAERSTIHIEEAGGEVSSREAVDLVKQVEELRRAVNKLKQEVDEVKYVLESVNPLEYVTIDHLGELIEKKVKEESIKLKKR